MSSSILEKAKDICEVIDNLIKESDKFLIDKSILYCKYVLSLNKDYVDSTVGDDYQKELEDYLMELDTYLSNK